MDRRDWTPRAEVRPQWQTKGGPNSMGVGDCCWLENSLVCIDSIAEVKKEILPCHYIYSFIKFCVKLVLEV